MRGSRRSAFRPRHPIPARLLALRASSASRGMLYLARERGRHGRGERSRKTDVMTTQLPALGIDIGGSKIAVGLVAADGRVIRRTQADTPAREGREAILGTAGRLAVELCEDQPISGVGIGSAGVIAGGKVVAATSLLADWTGTDLVRYFTELFDQPDRRPKVAALNDVHAHGTAEAWTGAGAGRDCVLLAAVGTGLGGVLVVGQRPLTGAHGVAGHLGHIASPAATGLTCSCGALGHLEAVSSGYGIVQLYRALGGDPVVRDAREVTARLGGDRYADRAVRQSAAALGSAIGDLINIIDPDVVIISGSVTGAGTGWWDALRDAAASAALPLTAGTQIVPAALGADAGIIGAARHVLDPESR